MSLSPANLRKTGGGAETRLVRSVLVLFAFSWSADDTRDREVLANEVRTEGRVELVDELPDDDDEDCGECVEVVASQESSVRKEVAAAFSKEAAAFCTWVGGLIIWLSDYLII